MVMGDMELETETLIIGSGPGGYSAAFRAADLGQEVTLVNSTPQLGGVCLYSGCIPSKTLLGLAELIADTKAAEEHGLIFPQPQLNLERVRSWKQSVIDDLASALFTQCKRRGVEFITGTAIFEDDRVVRLDHSEIRRISFHNAIIATGSTPISISGVEFKHDSRIMDSETALKLTDIPENLLIIGGGYVGLELGTIFSRFGTKVTVVEQEQKILTGIDRDLVKPLEQQLRGSQITVKLSTTVAEISETDNYVLVKLQTDSGQTTDEHFERVLVALGRRPATDNLALDLAGVALDEKGFVVIDEQQRSSVPNIYAVGDVTGGMLLAHKAIRQGRVAAEVIAGQNTIFDVRAIPAVIYTVPQIAWCGLTEEKAKQKQIECVVRKLPWRYSGRARMINSNDGLTKLILDPETGRILGGGVTGKNAENLISEIVLAVEMGALAEDLALCMHPHPTLSETIAEVADLFPRNSTL